MVTRSRLKSQWLFKHLIYISWSPGVSHETEWWRSITGLEQTVYAKDAFILKFLKNTFLGISDDSEYFFTYNFLGPKNVRYSWKMWIFRMTLIRFRGLASNINFRLRGLQRPPILYLGRWCSGSAHTHNPPTRLRCALVTKPPENIESGSLFWHWIFATSINIHHLLGFLNSY